MARENEIDRVDRRAEIWTRVEQWLRITPVEQPTVPTMEIQALLRDLDHLQRELERQNEELRAAQAELASSRDRYASLYQGAPVGYLTLDETGRVHDANRAAAEILRIELTALEGAELSAFVASEQQELWSRHLRSIFESDARKTCELKLRARQDASAWVRLESNVLHERGVRWSRTTLVDVTAIRRAQQQLEKSEQRYRRLTESLADYVYRVRIDRSRETEIDHGPGCEAVTGYTQQEFRDEPALWLSLIPPDDQAVVQEQVARVLAGENVVRVEHRILSKDGRTRWVSNTASREDVGGDLVAFDGLLRDITLRKQAEAALQRMNERLEEQVAEQTQAIQLQAKAIANLGEGVVITNDRLDWPGPEILFVNEAMCRITGYAADELIGQTPRLLQRDQSDRRMLEEIWLKLAVDEPVLCELKNYRKDGTPYDAEVFITPIHDADGRRTHLVSVHRDITDIKQLQKQVLEIAAEEDRRIGHELHDSTQQELTGLGLLAESLAEMLRAKSLPEAVPAARLAQGIEQSAARVQQLARGLVPVEIDAEGLRAALNDLAADVSKKFDVRCQLTSAGSTEVADNYIATHLYRIAQEATHNAVKHAQSDRITMSLIGDEDAITLQILDNGIGIGKKKGDGASGMGLRIMRYRASLIGATISVAPGSDRGTEVRVTILRRGI